MALTVANDLAPLRTPEPVAEILVTDLADLTHEMFAQVGLAATAQCVVRLARQLFGCDAAGLLLVAEGGAYEVAAGTSPEAEAAEARQIEHHQGPGMDVLQHRQPVIIHETRFDSRYRFWAPLAADLGFRSALSLSLRDSSTASALTLYSHRASSFGADLLPLGVAFAQHAAIALAVSRERGQLLRAASSRGVIGQAQGILMERYDLTADQAFALLRTASSHRNVRLRTIAEQGLLNRRFEGFGELVAALLIEPVADLGTTGRLEAVSVTPEPAA